MSNALPPRFDITRAEIERVVGAFYEACRAHPGLGPVFAKHVEDWDAHEAKVSDFWAGTILHERGYEGNALAAHVKAGNVQPGMFSTWLDLFDGVLRTELAPDQAAAWSALAHRIGQTLRAGVVERNTLKDGVPNLGKTGFSSKA
ncbi:group III truncated hemoglobin [Roseovarius phycicola]|uniref:Group III truncated hemoglobin n=1 Tax=Roseovarius phycicola TaxID=3080976 RepID=A0ABZ2HFL0_9RHOB